jgi:hypothetical protein
MQIERTQRTDPDLNADDPSPVATIGRPPTELAERATAYERYASFVTGGERSSGSSCGAGQDDQCESGRLAPAALYVREPGDVHEIEPSDVQQGAVGNCHVMAALCAMASSPEGRDCIARAITENKNAQGETVSYDVTLHCPQTHWFRPTTFTEVKVTVDASFVCPHATAGTDGNHHEVWPLVLEKAYAQYCGGYDGRGGWAADVMRVLTGRDAKHTEFVKIFGNRNYGADALSRDLAAGKMVVMGTWPDAKDHNLVGQHAYLVTGTTMQGGKLCVTLRNPWNIKEPDPVPVDDLVRFFHGVDVGSVR